LRYHQEDFNFPLKPSFSSKDQFFYKKSHLDVYYHDSFGDRRRKSNRFTGFNQNSDR